MYCGLNKLEVRDDQRCESFMKDRFYMISFSNSFRTFYWLLKNSFPKSHKFWICGKPQAARQCVIKCESNCTFSLWSSWSRCLPDNCNGRVTKIFYKIWHFWRIFFLVFLGDRRRIEKFGWRRRNRRLLDGNEDDVCGPQQEFVPCSLVSKIIHTTLRFLYRQF